MEKLSLTPDSVHEKILVEAISRVYTPGQSLNGEEILRLADPYGDWQGYWAYYLRVLAGK